MSAVEQLIKSLSPAEMADMLALIEELENRKRIKLAQADFLAFVALVDPTYKFGTHLKRLGGLLMDLETNAKDRVAVSMGPRFGKSQMISIYFPAWYIGKHPDHKLIIASHTADLAVDMLRKVRNLMQSATYKDIFPGVAIAADAKAAGKWNTNKGGEAYATGVGGALAGRGADLCCSPTAQVWTRERGRVPAGSVAVGEHLRSWHGWATVEAVITPEHASTVTVADRLQVSTEHPIWTFTRGWVPAADVKPADVLWSMTFVDTIVTRLQGVFYGRSTRAIPHAHVQHLGAHAAAMHKPKGGKLHQLWGAWGAGVRRMAEFCAVLCGYGAPTYAEAHTGSDGFAGGLHTGELPVGRRGGPAEQSQQQRVHRGVWGAADSCTVGPKDGSNQRPSGSSSVPDGHVTRAGAGGSEDEPQQTRYTPVPAGWVRRAGIRVLGACRTVATGCAIRDDKEGSVGFTVARGWARRICGLLLGVRFAGPISVEHHAPRPFINFMVSGDHTFVVDTIMSHNCIVDDPLSEQDLKAGNTDSLDVVYEWFRSGLRTRLMPGGRLAVLHTRWHQRDLIGRLVKDAAMEPGADQYEVFEFPAVLNADEPEDSPTPPKSLWPEQWSLEALLRTKASMPAWQWNAQYMQNPTAQESALIKKEWIKWWPKADPPKVDFIVQGWDTALTTKTRSDYSVGQTWGVFQNEDTDTTDVILLNQVRGKWEFPELKAIAHEQAKDWQPDSIIVEAKASGQPLIDEMRRSGLVVADFSPGKGQDKLSRVNAISDMFQSGQVWFPETRWASDVVDEILSFPAGEHDDQLDTVTLCLARIRRGGLITLNTDRQEPDEFFQARKAAYY